MIRDIHREKQRIDDLIEKAGTSEDDELKAHYAKYLCVLVSGHIDNAVRLQLMQFTKDKAHPNVTNYVSASLDRLVNLNEEKMRQILGAYNESWRDSFVQSISESQKAALDSICNHRNLIAHGRSNAVNITLNRLKNYYAEVTKVIVLLGRIVN
ncbi:MAG: hypothetical protein JW828_01840 [Sedimentisphaerales bacterium]|nr:hypothetical protein [Sedimentisphaerales bacterium]